VQYVDVVPVLVVVLAALVVAGVAAVVRPEARGPVVLGILLIGAVAVTLVVTLGPIAPGVPAERSLNLVPLRDIRAVLRSGNAGLATLNLAGNVALFVPVGFLLALAVRRWPIAVVLGVALSAAEEAVQYAVGRAADVDDVLLNGLGVVLGVGAALAVRALWTRTRRDRRTGGRDRALTSTHARPPDTRQ
jgi:glycopeptide antibiotics resistance protein